MPNLLKIVCLFALTFCLNQTQASPTMAIPKPMFDGFDKNQIVCYVYMQDDIYAVVKENEKFGLIGQQKGMVLPINYDDGFCFIEYDNFLSVFAFKQQAKWAIFDKSGNNETNFIFDELRRDNLHTLDQKSKLKTAKFNGKWGVLLPDFSPIINFKYDDLEELPNPIYIFKKDNKYGLIDNNDRLLLENDYEKIHSAGLARLNYTSSDNENIYNLYIARSNTLKNNPLLLKYLNQKNYNFAIVKKDSKWGVIDWQKKIIIPFDYDEILDSHRDATVFVVKKR